MTDHQPVTVTKMAIRQARQCGLTGDIEARIRGLFLHSVPTTHPMGNRQYGPFIMLAHEWTIEAFTMVGPRAEGQRQPHACKLCHGLMILRSKTEGGVSARPCPRAHNPDAPLCDERNQA